MQTVILNESYGVKYVVGWLIPINLIIWEKTLPSRPAVWSKSNKIFTFSPKAKMSFCHVCYGKVCNLEKKNAKKLMAHLTTYNLYSDVRIYVQEDKKWAFS